ncbi:hypothetical protein B0O99DRAFT_81890 [Bisporella sp. PMI_857]|nr:hypothetical protein B0O99DRAFT_81890 [Bisporella sp. PMI_857]
MGGADVHLLSDVASYTTGVDLPVAGIVGVIFRAAPLVAPYGAKGPARLGR